MCLVVALLHLAEICETGKSFLENKQMEKVYFQGLFGMLDRIKLGTSALRQYVCYALVICCCVTVYCSD